MTGERVDAVPAAAVARDARGVRLEARLPPSAAAGVVPAAAAAAAAAAPRASTAGSTIVFAPACERRRPLPPFAALRTAGCTEGSTVKFGFGFGFGSESDFIRNYVTNPVKSDFNRQTGLMKMNPSIHPSLDW